jgi:hypothetical protein
MLKIILLSLVLLVVLYFAYVFVVSLIETIKETRNARKQGGLNFEGDLRPSGELDVKLIRKSTT